MKRKNNDGSSGKPSKSANERYYRPMDKFVVKEKCRYYRPSIVGDLNTHVNNVILGPDKAVVSDYFTIW